MNFANATIITILAGFIPISLYKLINLIIYYFKLKNQIKNRKLKYVPNFKLNTTYKYTDLIENKVMYITQV